MVGCPACGADNPDDAPACRNCGLSSELFAPLTAVAGSTAAGTAEPRLLRELVELIGDYPTAPAAPPGPARLSLAGRFPAPRPFPRAAPPPAAGPLPQLPALGPGEPHEALSRQIDELIGVGRRLGLDLTDTERELPGALQETSLGPGEELRRRLFVQVAAELAESIEQADARRNELAGLLGHGAPESGIGEARETLIRGDLTGSFLALQRAQGTLGALEEQWGTVQILSLEAELLVESLRELGGDPSPALGPLARARERVSAGDRGSAEAMLPKVLLALWHLLAPLLTEEVRGLTARLLAGEQRGEPIGRGREALVAMAHDLRQRNFGAAIVAFRRARDAASRVPPPAEGGPVASPAPGHRTKD